jgi:hypothetical protein
MAAPRDGVLFLRDLVEGYFFLARMIPGLLLPALFSGVFLSTNWASLCSQVELVAGAGVCFVQSLNIIVCYDLKKCMMYSSNDILYILCCSLKENTFFHLI